MRINVYSCDITPIYIRDILFVNGIFHIVDENGVESNNGCQLTINNRDIRDFYRKGKEESLAYTLIRPFVDATMSFVKVQGFEWKEFLETNPDFIPGLVDMMVMRIKEVMDPYSEYYTR